jgi:ferrous iron transport protein B
MAMQEAATRPTAGSATRKILLVGNPNVGKSVIFGILTGRYVTVSNYPGTTVEVTRGNADVLGRKWQVIDTPGVNNLMPHSEDERVTRDIVMEESGRVVIQVADSKNLRRGLLITLELIEMGVPMVLVLNMEDEARGLGVEIDHRRLAELLGIPVVFTVATRRKGLERMLAALEKPGVGTFQQTFPKEIETAVQKIEPLLPEGPISRRSLAVMLLAGDETLTRWLYDHLPEKEIVAIEETCRHLQTGYSEPLAYRINRLRLAVVDSIVGQVWQQRAKRPVDWVQRTGNLAMHPVWGIPILIGVLILLYLFVGDFGAGTLVDLLEKDLFGRLLIPWMTRLGETWIPVAFVRDLLFGTYGICTMALTYALAIVLPIVGTFFIAFGVLEDSGYMPRLAVMANRIFRTIGLSGKAVLPMMLGLGCDTMATLTTRILDTRKERILVTLLLALGVPCSAQLGVILGMLAELSAMAVAVWIGVVAATMLAVGFLASRLLPGEDGAFILELPPIRLPKLNNILVKTLARIEWYLKEAVPLFILGTLVLFALDRMRLLGLIESAAAPIVREWLGLPRQATEAFLIGFLRRDYGAAGLFALARADLLDHRQILVSLVTITLFVPCIANLFIIIKERGWRTACWMLLVIFPIAFGVGGILNMLMQWKGWMP